MAPPILPVLHVKSENIIRIEMMTITNCSIVYAHQNASTKNLLASTNRPSSPLLFTIFTFGLKSTAPIPRGGANAGFCVAVLDRTMLGFPAWHLRNNKMARRLCNLRAIMARVSGDECMNVVSGEKGAMESTRFCRRPNFIADKYQ